ncbi:MAG TPA: AAA family ATPase [Burkholderiaceae bacterium]|nr:AAA family ATPase [Burkholderiaceae bacterium]
MEERRERRRRTRVDGLDAAITRAEAEGDLAAALEHAHALVTLDPLSEHAHRRVIRLHYLRGDTAAALAAYERCRELLKVELKARPSAETEALRALLTSASAQRLPAARVAPLTVLRPPRLVGRDAEWEALQFAWQRGQTAFVLGEAGMGKTRLVTDLAQVRQPVLLVGARPGDERVVYALIARLLRQLARERIAALEAGVRKELARLLPELGEAEPIRSDAERARFYNAVAAALAAQRESLHGVIVDDLHFADDASVELIQYLLGAAELRWVFAARPAELGAAARSLLEVVRERATVVELAPLTEAAIAELVESLALPGIDAKRVAPQLLRQTGGNPLFLLETLKSWLAQGVASEARLPAPASVGALIERRIGRLSPEAVRLARCAAIAGQDFSVELAAHVLGVRPIDLADAWAELEAAQVFRDGAFAHDLIAEAARASVPAPVARELHAELARYLGERGGPVVRIAEHCLASEQWHPAGMALVQCAAEAGRARRWREQAALLERAVACFDRLGDTGARFEALLARVHALIYCDLGEETLASARAAEAAAVTDGQRVRAALALLHVLTHRGDTAEAVAVARRGLDLARASNDQDAEMRFTLPLSGNLCDQQRAADALQLLEPIREWVDANAGPCERCEYYIALGVALDQTSRLGAAIQAFETACAIAREHDATAALAEAMSNLASAHAKVGRVQRAVALGRQAVDLMRGDEPPAGRPMQSQLMLAHRLRDLGHFSEALPLFETALAAFQAAGSTYWWFAAAHRLALAYLQLGQPARAARLLAREPAGEPPRTRAMWTVVRAEAARLSSGDRRQEARALFRQALDLLKNDPENGAYRIATLFATAGVPPEEGEAMATSLAAWANARERFGMAMAAHVRAAQCALAQRAAARALPHVEAALRLAQDYCADSQYRAELWLTAARVLLALGREAEAAEQIKQGCDWVDTLARDHVPAEFRDSFLHRNPVNRELLTLATRLK